MVRGHARPRHRLPDSRTVDVAAHAANEPIRGGLRRERQCAQPEPVTIILGAILVGQETAITEGTARRRGKGTGEARPTKRRRR